MRYYWFHIPVGKFRAFNTDGLLSNGREEFCIIQWFQLRRSIISYVEVDFLERTVVVVIGSKVNRGCIVLLFVSEHTTESNKMTGHLYNSLSQEYTNLDQWEQSKILSSGLHI